MTDLLRKLILMVILIRSIDIFSQLMISVERGSSYPGADKMGNKYLRF